MVNFDIILFLFILAAALIVWLAKRRGMLAPKQEFPGSTSNDHSTVNLPKLPVSIDIRSTYRNRSIDDDWGSGDTSLYAPAPVPQATKKTARKPQSSHRPSTKIGSSLPQHISAAKVAKRTSSFVIYFRQKQSIQLAVVNQVVLGPCRAYSPYEEP